MFHGERKHIVFPSSTRYACFYTAQYSSEDVEHDVEPLNAGSRLVVVYRLCWRGRQNDMPGPDVNDKKTRSLRSAATDLFKKSDVIVFCLAHKYTEQAIEDDGVEEHGREKCPTTGLCRHRFQIGPRPSDAE